MNRIKPLRTLHLDSNYSYYTKEHYLLFETQDAMLNRVEGYVSIDSIRDKLHLITDEKLFANEEFLKGIEDMSENLLSLPRLSNYSIIMRYLFFKMHTSLYGFPEEFHYGDFVFLGDIENQWKKFVEEVESLNGEDKNSPVVIDGHTVIVYKEILLEFLFTSLDFSVFVS